MYEDVNEIEYLKQRNIGPAQSAHVSNTVVPQAGDLNLRDRQLTHSKKLEIRPEVHGVRIRVRGKLIVVAKGTAAGGETHRS